MRQIMDYIVDTIEFDLFVREEDYFAYKSKLDYMILAKSA
jgi:hypothetical protein